MRRIALIMLLPALASCAWFDSLTNRDTLSVLLRNRDRWLKLGIDNYSFRYQQSCFCGPESTQDVTITVLNGDIYTVRNTATQQLVPLSPYASWPTIDSLFVRSERNLRGSYKLKITYDGTYHFPGRVEGDIPFAIDDEYTARAWGLVTPVALP